MEVYNGLVVNIICSQIKVAAMAASELKKKHGTVYQVGSFANLLCKYHICSFHKLYILINGVEFGDQFKDTPFLFKK